MGIPTAWQLAVTTDWISLSDSRIICCKPRPEYYAGVLDAGSVVYVISCSTDKTGIARCWLPMKKIYADIYLSELMPVMCENDALEIELKYPQSNLGQWLKQISAGEQK